MPVDSEQNQAESREWECPAVVTPSMDAALRALCATIRFRTPNCSAIGRYWRGGMSGPESRYTDVGAKLWPALLAVAKAADAWSMIRMRGVKDDYSLYDAMEAMRAALK